MDRDRVLELGRKILKNSCISSQEMFDFVSEYCIDKGKDPVMVARYIPILMTSPYLPIMFSYALEYFEKKYNIIYISSANDFNTIYQKY